MHTTGQRQDARPAVAPAAEQDNHNTYTQQEHGMPEQQVSASVDTIARTEQPNLCPTWADKVTVLDDEMTFHSYEAPGTFNSETGSAVEPLTGQRLILEQLVVTEPGAAPRVNAPTIRLANVDRVTFDGAEWPIEQARIMHAQLGHLLARIDAATPTVPAQATADPRCLPGCEETHAPEHKFEIKRQCCVTEVVGEVALDFGGTVTVMARATTFGDETYSDVVLHDLEPDAAGIVEANSVQARLLAAQLVAGADRADAVLAARTAGAAPKAGA
ncbi:hypothetical protein ACVDFE_02265 [Lentzea chajnantorensis]